MNEEFLRSVRDAVDIVDIASGMTSLRKVGQRYTGLCPFHREKSPSFTLNADMNVYHCFGCGAGGDAIDLYMRHTGDDFRSAIEALAQRYGIQLPQQFAAKEENSPGEVLEAAQAFYSKKLAESQEAGGYLDKRGISPELRQRYGLGYAPEGWSNISAALDRFPLQALLDVGLVAVSEQGRPYDRFRNRLMFPIFTASGRIVGFGGRALGDDRAKYVNTAETASFKKSELLYGLSQAKKQIRATGRAILVEGYFDVLACAAAGLEGTVAAMGTAFSAQQAKELARFAPEVVMAYDGDAAGVKAASRTLPILLAAKLDVKSVQFADGDDPDSVRLASGPEALAIAISKAGDAVLAEIDRAIAGGKESPVQMSSAIREILGQVQDTVARDLYAKKIADKLGVQPMVVSSPAPKADQAKNRGLSIAASEEAALSLLLSARSLPQRLPPSEVFESVECREIYSAFATLYMAAGSIPDQRDLVEELRDRRSEFVSALARIALADERGDLGAFQAALGLLLRRWTNRRRADFGAAMRQAAGSVEVQRQLVEQLQAILRENAALLESCASMR
jgi:DNA primase